MFYYDRYLLSKVHQRSVAHETACPAVPPAVASVNKFGVLEIVPSRLGNPRKCSRWLIYILHASSVKLTSTWDFSFFKGVSGLDVRDFWFLKWISRDLYEWFTPRSVMLAMCLGKKSLPFYRGNLAQNFLATRSVGQGVTKHRFRFVSAGLRFL